MEKEIKKKELYSFADIVKEAKLVRRDGTILPDCDRKHNRMANVFMLLFDTTNLKEKRILDPQDWIEKYCFSPGRAFTSAIDYFVKIELVRDDYSILDQNRFSSLSQIWEELFDIDIYEKVSQDIVTEFIEFYRESDSNSRLVSMDFNPNEM